MVPQIDPAGWARLCDMLRTSVTAQLIEVGELLGGSALSPAEGEDEAMHDYVLALDAHAAASKLLDEAVDPPDLAGVSVLLDIATVHFQAAQDRHAGHHPAHRAHRCFYNPLHEPAANDPGPRQGLGSKRTKGSKGSKASKGSSASRRRPNQVAQARPGVPACAACLHRIHARQMPDVLVAPIAVATKKGKIDGVPVPYFMVPAEQSLWAATGYGTLPGHSDTELVARVLRGEHRRKPAAR